MITSSFKTTDGFKVDVYVFNSIDYSAHVFIEDGRFGYPMTKRNSIHGKDVYECLTIEGQRMTKEEIIRTFNL